MNAIRPYIRYVLIAALTAALPAGAWAQVEIGDRGFTITTPRLSAVIHDGVVIGLTNLATGEVHGDAALGDLALPRGLGHMTGNPEAMMRLHSPWGNQELNQELSAGVAAPTMHYPAADARFEDVEIAGGVRATWTGLTNGEADFPNETLTIEATVDPGSGQLLLRAVGTSDTPGVYGVQVPVANLHPDHRVYVASFGGVMYDNTSRPSLITLGGTPFWEAPVVALEGREGSFCLWVEDDDFPTSFFFLNWSGDSFSTAIEHLNYMPFDDLTSTESVTWKLDVFSGGWVDAMTPYKQWYAATFAPEMEIRASTKWADKIRVIIDHATKTEEVYRKLAVTFDPETVMIHDWNARAPQFDRELPDWTPRAGYVDQVNLAHKYGFRTMAYVNTYCVNFNSPVFIRDNIAEFGLTRKIRGIYRYTAEPQSFETAQDGQILYLDPLSARWREYHTDMMLTWREETGTDANYEDVGGTAGDFGNGMVDGLIGAQGGREQFRELLQRNPEVPMASEYAPDHMAFAARWPLRYQQVWGNNATRVWWMKHQRPVSAYIHGPLAYAWIPVINAESEFNRHVVVACSDALGGMAQFSGTMRELEANAGIIYHMKQRAQLFAHRQLTPYFTPERQDDSLACMYTDSDGRIYRYYTTDTLQQMIGPDNEPIYQRAANVNVLETPLTIPGWPAATEGKIIGLDPAIRYALSRGQHDRTKVQVLDMPEGIKVSRFESTDQRTVLALSPVNGDSGQIGSVVIQPNEKFSAVMLNDSPAELPQWDDETNSAEPVTYDVEFPAYFVFVERGVTRPQVGELFGDGHEIGRYISMDTGLERGGEFVVPHRRTWPVPGVQPAPTFLFVNGGSECEIALDYLVQVPDEQSSVLVYVKNNQTRFGNGGIARLYINGREVRAADLGPQPNPDWEEGMDTALRNVWDTDIHAWQVPVGQMAGQAIAVTIASDAKGQNNADQLWWVRPSFVHDPDQKPRFVRYTEDGEERPVQE